MSAVEQLRVKLAQTNVRPYLAKRGDKIVPVVGHVRKFVKAPSDEAADSWGKDKYGEWAKSVPKKDVEALSQYRATGYRWVNSQLRGTAEVARAEWNESEGYEDITKDDLKRWAKEAQPPLDHALETAPRVPMDITVFRGMPKHELQVGDEIDDPAYVSTSLTRGRPDDFASWQTERSEWPEEDGPKQPPGETIEIRVPKGTKAIYLDAFDEDQSRGLREHELLLARGLTYRVVSVDPTVLEVV